MPSKHIVRPGDSIASIARDEGFLWRTLWDHPDNAELRRLRKDPNVLLDGDVVALPDIEAQAHARPTGGRHRFVRKGEPTKLKLTLTRLGKPRINESYDLIVDGTHLPGATDGQGRVEHFVPGNAKTARLLLRDGKEEHLLRIGHLDPIDSVSGAQQRLRNLGYECGGEDGEIGPATEAAVRAFQQRNDLPVTGGLNRMTQDKLKAQHN